MKFIADSMLGRLSRWLRLIGYDTLYYPHVEGRLLLKSARQENRILLTRNTHLVKVRGLGRHLLLTDNDPFKQLKCVVTAFDLDPHGEIKLGQPRMLSRCADCNACLVEVSREEVKHSVPEYVYRTSNVFRNCPGCGKVYWDGTHPEKFRKKLSEILQLI